MWKQQILKLSPQAKTALEDNLKGKQSPFNLSLSGLKIGVHNWTHGMQEKSNRYLSPINAVKALQDKLCDYQDQNRPKNVQDVVVLMITAGNDGDFIAALEQAAELIPDPVFKQSLDYARAFKDLQLSKMIKTLPMAHPAFGKSADITPQSARVLNGIMRGVQALNEPSSNPFKVIEQLKAKKAEKQAENQKKVEKMLKSAVQLYAFCGRGLLDEVSLLLSQNIPATSNVFTAVLCFVGDNLTQLREMLNEPV